MTSMFFHAKKFGGDISHWDVSSVTHMDYMFEQAKEFQVTLCGAAWVNSKAFKTSMFNHSGGKIAKTACDPPTTATATTTTTAAPTTTTAAPTTTTTATPTTTTTAAP